MSLIIGNEDIEQDEIICQFLGKMLTTKEKRKNRRVVPANKKIVSYTC